VRQLENLCHWLTVMAPTQGIEISDLPAELKPGGGKAPDGYLRMPIPRSSKVIAQT